MCVVYLHYSSDLISRACNRIYLHLSEHQRVIGTKTFLLIILKELLK